MAVCAQSSPSLNSPFRQDIDLNPKIFTMMSQKIDQYLANFENHYILAFQESLLNVSANFKILSDALALDEEGIKLCTVKNIPRRKERLALASEVSSILEKFKSSNSKTVPLDSIPRINHFQITDKKHQERQPPPTPTLKECNSQTKFKYQDASKRDSERDLPKNQDNTIFLGGDYVACDRSKNFSFFLPSIDTSHMSSEYLNKSDREEGPLEVVEFKGVSQIARSRSPVAKAIQNVQKKFRTSRSHSSDRAKEKKQTRKVLGSSGTTMSTDSLHKKQKFHSFIYTSKKLRKDDEQEYKHSESMEYGDYTVNIIQEGSRNRTGNLSPQNRHSFQGIKTLKQAQKISDFLSTALDSQKKESTFKQKRASMPEQEIEDKMGLQSLTPRNESPKPAESPVKLKLIEAEKESPPSPKFKKEIEKQKTTPGKKLISKYKPSLDLTTPRSQKGKSSSKRTPLSSHRQQNKPYQKQVTQWNSCQRQKQSKMYYSRQGSKVAASDRAVKRKASLGRVHVEEEKGRTPSRKESSKSAILVETRDRSASPPSKMSEQNKKFYMVMEPHVIHQIAELQGAFIPPIAFVNREVLQNFLKYREHEFNVQCGLFDKKIQTAKEELSTILQRKKFTLSKDSTRDLRAMIQQNQWTKLVSALDQELVGNKDVVILRLYFTFLGKSFSGKNSTFIKQASKYLWEVKPNFEFRLNPETHFVFTENVKKKVKELLISSTDEKYTNVETSKLAIFDVLTNILIEAMQYSTLIPHRVETEIESMLQAKKEAKETLKLIERLRLKIRA